MKKLLLICVTLLGLNTGNAFAQCPNDNSQIAGNLTPPGAGMSTTLTYPSGRYVTAYVYSGVSYTVSTCGTSAYDTQLTVFDDASLAFYGYSDDACGLQSTVNFVANNCGYVRILLDQYSCNNSGLNTPVTMTQNNADTSTVAMVCGADTSVAADPGVCSAVIALEQPTVYCGHSLTNDAPSTFPVGTTPVVWQVIGTAGPTSCLQMVTVIDSQPPVITTCSADTMMMADAGMCSISGVVLDVPVSTDNCGVSSTTNDAPASFPVGVTTVTWTVTDIHSNSTTCTQMVTVVDNENPIITCPNDTTISTDAGVCDATPVSFGMPVTTDNCGIDVTMNDAPATFPKGMTTVNWSTMDIHGLTATCAQVVTVVDTENPMITCPNDTTVNVNYAGCMAIVSWPMLLSSDNCAVDTTMSTVVNGDTLSLGTTTVTYTVMDEAGNTSTCSFDITVVNTLAATLDSADNIACNGGLTGSIAVSTTGGNTPYTYDWDNDGTGDNDDTEDLAGLATGTYMLTITDSLSCTASFTHTLTEPAVLSVALMSSTNIACNGGLTGSIGIITTGGTTPYAYDWDNDGTGDNDDTQDLTGLGDGTYMLTVTDSLNCTATFTHTLTEPAALALTLTPTPQSTATPNGAVNLLVNGGVSPYSYDWNNDGTGDFDDTEDLGALAAGTYTVVVQDDNGCTGTGSAVVSSTVGINELTNTNVVQVYPNPSNGSFQVTLGEFTSGNTVEVYNATGELIYSAPINSQNTFVTLNQANGLVMVRVKNNGAELFSTTLIIQR